MLRGGRFRHRRTEGLELGEVDRVLAGEDRKPIRPHAAGIADTEAARRTPAGACERMPRRDAEPTC
jgi:hypothetical protein